MKEATKRSTYSEFVKLSPEERLTQSELLRKLKPTMIPVIISPFQKHLQDIPNCKFLFQKDLILHVQFSKIRDYITKNKAVNPNQTLYFCYNRKILSGTKKVADFVSEFVKDNGRDDDGWLYLEYGIQDWSG